MNIARLIVAPAIALTGTCVQAQDVHFGAQATLAVIAKEVVHPS